MSVEQNKALVQEFYGYYQKGEWDAAKAMCREDYKFYHNLDTPKAAQDYFEHEKEAFGSIPGYTIDVLDMVGEGDKVAAYLVIESKKPKLRFSLLNLIRFEDGKIADKRAHYDMHDVSRQLSDQA